MKKYLLLDKDDITQVRGVITQKELLKTMTHSQINTLLINSKPYLGKFILIEDECENKEETFQDVKIAEGKKGIYYASRSGEFFIKFKKSGKIRYIKKFKEPNLDYALVTILKTNYRAKNLIAKHFIKGYTRNDVVIQKNGDMYDCNVDNLIVIPRSKHSKKHYGQAHARKVGLYENDKLARTWSSARKCAKDLFCCNQTINRICNGEIKDKMYDVRWL